MNGALEYCACPLCGGSERTAPAYRFPPHGVVQCNACSLWYLYPRLDEEEMLASYASNGYFTGNDGLSKGYTDYALQERALRATFARFLRQLEKEGITGGSLLEAGCGYGYLLDEARPFFEWREGTDFSDDAVRQASPQADRIWPGGLDALPKRAHFDCAIAVEVMEHIYDPNRFMRELASHLKPGGWAVVAVPDMGSLWRRLMGRHWPSFKIPEHVCYYDRHTMVRLFEQNGFTDLRPIAFPHLFPLELIAEKLGMSVKGRIGRMNIWLPGVVLAMAGRLK